MKIYVFVRQPTNEIVSSFCMSWKWLIVRSVLAITSWFTCHYIFFALHLQNCTTQWHFTTFIISIIKKKNVPISNLTVSGLNGVQVPFDRACWSSSAVISPEWSLSTLKIASNLINQSERHSNKKLRVALSIKILVLKCTLYKIKVNATFYCHYIDKRQ